MGSQHRNCRADGQPCQLAYASAAEADPLLPYLDAAEGKRLVTYFSTVRPRPGGHAAVHIWQELRNRASVGLQCGAGLTLGEVQALLVSSPVVDCGSLGACRGRWWRRATAYLPAQRR